MYRCMSCTSSCGSTGNDITTLSDTPKQQTGSSLEVIHCSASVLLQALPNATERLLYATSSNGNLPVPQPLCAVVPPMMLPVIISCSSLLFIRVRERIHCVSIHTNLTFNFRQAWRPMVCISTASLGPRLTNIAVAIKALHDMRSAAGFDRRMLLLATQISHRLESKGVLLSVLEALLATLVAGSGAGCETVVEAMTLIRCIIRLVLKLMSDPTANQYVICLRGHEFSPIRCSSADVP